LPRMTRTAVRQLPRTTCDRCASDYADAPERVGTVQVASRPGYWTYWKTICVPCASELGVTGYPTVLGTQPPPPDSQDPIPTGEQVADLLWNGGRRVEREQERTRPDIEGELRRIAQ